MWLTSQPIDKHKSLYAADEDIVVVNFVQQNEYQTTIELVGDRDRCRWGSTTATRSFRTCKASSASVVDFCGTTLSMVSLFRSHLSLFEQIRVISCRWRVSEIALSEGLSNIHPFSDIDKCKLGFLDHIIFYVACFLFW